jgi:hypothetical protein
MDCGVTVKKIWMVKMNDEIIRKRMNLLLLKNCFFQRKESCAPPSLDWELRQLCFVVSLSPTHQPVLTLIGDRRSMVLLAKNLLLPVSVQSRIKSLNCRSLLAVPPNLESSDVVKGGWMIF